MTASDIVLEAARRGLRLKPVGQNLGILPARLCTPEFEVLLRQHKEEILEFLEFQSVKLTVDQLPWVHVAEQVLAGEFDGADRSTLTSLTIGLRSIAHPSAPLALARLGTVQ